MRLVRKLTEFGGFTFLESRPSGGGSVKRHQGILERLLQDSMVRDLMRVGRPDEMCRGTLTSWMELRITLASATSQMSNTCV